MTLVNDVVDEKLPRHVVVIMDGNGRWAQKKILPRIAGHKEGVNALRKIVKTAAVKGIKVLTVYAFSSENWNRPSTEVSLLMDLFMTSLKQERQELYRDNVKLRFIGEHAAFSEKLQYAICEAEKITGANTGLELVIAANYGGRWDITNAFKLLYEKIQSGLVKIDDVDESLIQSNIAISNLPEPDLFIRTGGEIRISNFLLWQLAYTELYFTETLWPDFTPSEFEKALMWFSSRKRRFGRTNEQVERVKGA
jgi:undecaprenyl diphosphate synthase